MTTIKEIRAENLRLLKDEAGTLVALAKMIDTSPAHLGQILSGVRGLGDALARKIEDGCGRPIGWMDKSHNASDAAKFDENAKLVPLGTRAIPVISAIQAGAMKEIAVPYAAGDGYAAIYVDDSYSKWAFGLEIEGDSMMPEYRPGDVVIIEPEWEPRPGDCVAAKNGKQEATFKKYRLRGFTADGNDIFELVPLNDDYPILRSDETPLTIIGVMAELRRKHRRR